MDRLKGMLGGAAQNSVRPSPQAGRSAPDTPLRVLVEQTSPQLLIEADLRRLNAAFPGLGDATAHYVLHGGPRDALVRLSGSGAGKRIEPEGMGTYPESIVFGDAMSWERC
jgi:hypothetical protein